MNCVKIIMEGESSERHDLANRINGMCLAIGKVIRHYQKESDVPEPIPTDAHVILIEKEKTNET